MFSKYENLKTVEGEVCRQGAGTIFGEFSLLYTHLKRTATVRAVTFCDCFIMDKESLMHCFQKFPACHQQMVKNAKREMRKKIDRKRYKDLRTSALQAREENSMR